MTLTPSPTKMIKTIASKVLVVILLVVIAPLAIVGWNDETETKDGRGQDERNLASNPTSTNTIVEVAVGAVPEFETLVAALTAADLVDALSGSGPFTVFGQS